MKKRLAFVAATMLSGLFAAPAMAQEAPAPQPRASADDHSGFYAGAGINLYFIDKDDAAEGLPIAFIDQPSPGAFLGRLGYAFNNFFAVEVEAGFGGAKSEFEGGASTLDIGVGSPLGANLVVTLPIGEGGGYLLGKGGYSSVTVERELNGVTAPDIDISGASFGIGGGIRSTAWDFRGEYSFMSGDAKSGVLGIFALYSF
jgi:Outer membrane protein beta-barrel domain